MNNTATRTATYTVVDIRKTFEGFEADLRMIARRTDKWSMSYVDDIFHDIIKLAESRYLSSISVVLKDSNGKVIKATKFVVNSEGTSISSDRAGRNDWHDIPNTTLSVVLSYTEKWHDLSSGKQDDFEQENDFKIGWTSTSIDTSFSHLTKTSGQLYASNGYELQKQNFN